MTDKKKKKHKNFVIKKLDPIDFRLLPKQRHFADEYLIHSNATLAAINAGYSKKTAANMGNENLNKPHIEAYIQNKINERSKRLDITADRVLQEIARVAYARLSDVSGFDASGVCLKNSDELSDDILAAVSEVSITNGMNGRSTKIKMHNKTAALDKLGKYLKLFEDTVNHTGSVELVKIIDDVPRGK